MALRDLAITRVPLSYREIGFLRQGLSRLKGESEREEIDLADLDMKLHEARQELKKP